jgi:uncharacterized protein YegL
MAIYVHIQIPIDISYFKVTRIEAHDGTFRWHLMGYATVERTTVEQLSEEVTIQGKNESRTFKKILNVASDRVTYGNEDKSIIIQWMIDETK